jgi:FtsZ-binding cell division protein ZapB
MAQVTKAQMAAQIDELHERIGKGHNLVRDLRDEIEALNKENALLKQRMLRIISIQKSLYKVTGEMEKYMKAD